MDYCSCTSHITHFTFTFIFRWFLHLLQAKDIVHYQSKVYKVYTIANLIKENNGIVVSKYGVAKARRSIERRPGSERMSSITSRIKELIEENMKEDDETI